MAELELARNRRRHGAWAPATVALLVTGLLLLSGCGVGPPMINRDRLDYVSAISDSWKRQMLLNLVKTRYADAPVFLEITSVINQYSVEGQMNALGSLTNPAWSYRQDYGATVRAYDRPTITYTPLTGERFGRSMLTPVPPTAILSFIQSGWPSDYVLRLMCNSINGVRNVRSGQLSGQSGDPEFEELMAAFRRVQVSETIGMRLAPEKGGGAATIVLGRKLNAAGNKDAETVTRLLGLSPDANEFRVVFGVLPKDNTEIAILSRSMLQVLVELAACIDVPEDHQSKGIAGPGSSSDSGVSRLMTIRSSRSRPWAAFVAVPYKGYWFWIEEKDFASKRMLSLLRFFFTLTETGGASSGPIITVPTG